MDITTQNQETEQIRDRNKALQQQNAFLLSQLKQANKGTETAHAMISSLTDQYHYLLSSRTPLPNLTNKCSQTCEELSPPSIDQNIHDQLITDLKEEFHEQITHLSQENEANKERLDIKTFEHELNLIQFQRLKEDYITLYQLIITFGNDPVTIPFHPLSLHPDPSPSQEYKTKASDLPPSFPSDTVFPPSHQCTFLCTTPVPTFNDTVQWALSTIPNFPKIPLTKYTICEPGNLLSPLWEDYSELSLTAQDLELPQSQLFTPREKSIVTFYENQIKEMQELKVIGSPHPQNSLSLDTSEITNEAIQFDAIQNSSLAQQFFIMQTDPPGSYALVALKDNTPSSPSIVMTPTSNSLPITSKPNSLSSTQSFLPPSSIPRHSFSNPIEQYVINSHSTPGSYEHLTTKPN